MTLGRYGLPFYSFVKKIKGWNLYGNSEISGKGVAVLTDHARG